MAPRLPTETLAHILALENVDQSSVERQLNRQRFELVCRDWFVSVDRWSELTVVGVGALHNLRDVLKADVHFGDTGGAVGPRVKSLRFELKLGGIAHAGVGGVIECVPKLERLEVVASSKKLKMLGTTLPRKLKVLSKLKHLALEGIELPADSLPKFVPHLAALESFSLKRCLITNTDGFPHPPRFRSPFDNLFSTNTRLCSIHLHVSTDQAVAASLLSNLPASMTHLLINCTENHRAPSVSPPVAAAIQAAAGQLTHLQLEAETYYSGMPELDLQAFVRLQRLALSLDVAGLLPASLDEAAALTELIVSAPLHGGVGRKRASVPLHGGGW